MTSFWTANLTYGRVGRERDDVYSIVYDDMYVLTLEYMYRADGTVLQLCTCQPVYISNEYSFLYLYDISHHYNYARILYIQTMREQ